MSEITAPRLSTRQLARQRRLASLRRTWRSFRSHRSGVFGLVILVFFVAVALAAPLLADSSGLDVTHANGPVLGPPSSTYWLGTDENGRSVLTLLIWGSRISLFVGLSATLISMVIGTLLGLVSGYFGGWIGRITFRITEWVLVIPFLPLAIALASVLGRGLLNIVIVIGTVVGISAGFYGRRVGGVLMRFTEWFLVIPFLPLAIALAAVLGRGLFNIVIVIGVTSWPGTALLIRSQTLSIRERPYVERAEAIGAGRWHQLGRHVLPNVMPMVFANTTLTVAIAILSETTLSFLGLGDPTRTSWGTMLDGAYHTGAITTGCWWYVIPPGVCVVLVVLAFTLVGQALEEVLNPRLRARR